MKMPDPSKMDTIPKMMKVGGTKTKKTKTVINKIYENEVGGMKRKNSFKIKIKGILS